jgi:hypothetical protein
MNVEKLKWFSLHYGFDHHNDNLSMTILCKARVLVTVLFS